MVRRKRMHEGKQVKTNRVDLCVGTTVDEWKGHCAC